VNNVDEEPVIPNLNSSMNVPEVQHSLYNPPAPNTVYEITNANVLNHLLGESHGVTTGSFAVDKNATHFTISKVAETDTSSGYFVNFGPVTEVNVVTQYTHAQEAQLHSYLGNNASHLGSRAFSTTITANVDTVDNLSADEGIFFSLSGPDANYFAIDNQTGEIFWSSPRPHADFETVSNATYDIIVNANDFSSTTGIGRGTSESVRLNLTDVNENPSLSITGFAGQNPSRLENSDLSTPIASISAYDDDGDTLSFSIDNTADFTLQGTTGVGGSLQTSLLANSLDHEVKDTMYVTISTTDGVNTTSKQLQLSVGDVNDDPVITSDTGTLATAVENTRKTQINKDPKKTKENITKN
jgi:hypothetical protein